MNTIKLKKLNKQIRNKRPILSTDEICSTFITGDLLEIGFLSKQCRNDQSGSCLMCDYGYMNKMDSIDNYIKEMKDILAEHSYGIDYLLLCTNGSFFDSYQIPKDLLTAILIEAQNSSIPNIIIETHYNDITREKLNLIYRIIHKPITIEMGLETINQKYQDTLFMKDIDLKKYLATIQLIKEYNYNIELNIMLGLPFLSPKQQMEDAIETIEWTVQHDCFPVLFPINIKYYTFLRYLYDNNNYEPISLWLVIMVLDKISDKALENIVIAWYGNRDESYADSFPTIMPQSCSLCNTSLNVFFKNLHRTNDINERRELISSLLNQDACECITGLRESLKQFDCNFDEEYQHLLNNLITDN